MLRRILILLSVVVCALGASAPAMAATPAASSAPSGQGLEISPPLIDKKVDPGQTLTVEIKVRNVTRSTLVTTGSVEDFVAQGEEGQAKLLIGQDVEPSTYTIRAWVTDIPSLTLAAGEQKVARVAITVPSNAGPGGHYGVIRFSGRPPELEGTGVSLSASIGTLVLLNVSGKQVVKASIAELYAAQNGKKNNFFQQGPITISERIKNEGNVHFKPTGTVRVTNTFGKEIAVLSINPKGGNVLPQSIRKFEQTLNKKNLFGRYTGTVDIQYAGQTLNGSFSFWVLPLKAIGLVLGVIAILVIFLRLNNRQVAKRALKKK